MKERIAIEASIYYFNEDGKERQKQLSMNDKDSFLSCVEAFAQVIHITNFRLTEMHYTTPAGCNYKNVTEWYTIIDGKVVMTNRYED